MSEQPNLIDRKELAISELEGAKALLDEFIQRHMWNSEFRKNQLGFIINKLLNVSNNLWTEKAKHEKKF